jgi:hypothetical protein
LEGDGLRLSDAGVVPGVSVAAGRPPGNSLPSGLRLALLGRWLFDGLISGSARNDALSDDVECCGRRDRPRGGDDGDPIAKPRTGLGDLVGVDEGTRWGLVDGDRIPIEVEAPDRTKSGGLGLLFEFLRCFLTLTFGPSDGAALACSFGGGAVSCRMYILGDEDTGLVGGEIVRFTPLLIEAL